MYVTFLELIPLKYALSIFTGDLLKKISVKIKFPRTSKRTDESFNLN